MFHKDIRIRRRIMIYLSISISLLITIFYSLLKTINNNHFCNDDNDILCGGRCLYNNVTLILTKKCNGLYCGKYLCITNYTIKDTLVSDYQHFYYMLGSIFSIIFFVINWYYSCVQVIIDNTKRLRREREMLPL